MPEKVGKDEALAPVEDGIDVKAASVLEAAGRTTSPALAATTIGIAEGKAVAARNADGRNVRIDVQNGSDVV